jgi:Family of unknown function (DUF6886)
VTQHLFHFSDEPGIKTFAPQRVRVAAKRRPGQEWLNEALVWAIDEWHEPLYLFPRECPRILLWPTPHSTEEDRRSWFGDSAARMIAFVEDAWFRQLCSKEIHRYAMPVSSFEDIGDAGMWVSREAVTPSRMDTLTDLPKELGARDVEVRVCDSLLPLKGLWQTTLHASGIRLRNARGWGEPGWPHSPP